MYPEFEKSIVYSSDTASSVLFVHSIWPVYGVAAVWVSFIFMFVFQDSCACCQSASSVCISQRQQWPSRWAVLTQLLSWEKLCVHILKSHNNPALRYNRYFNIATAQRQREATFVLICFAWELPRTNCFSSVHFYAHCLQNNCHAPHGVWHQKDFDVTHTVELLSKERAWIKCCQIPTEAAESPSLTWLGVSGRRSSRASNLTTWWRAVAMTRCKRQYTNISQ